MKTLPGIVSLLLPLALAACAGMSGRPASVPTSMKTGQSWVVTRQPVAERVLDTCSRASPARQPGRVSGYWAPGPQQVDELEARQQALAPTIASPQDYDRQYVGVVVDGRRLIYINAFKLPDQSDIDPSREAVVICDAGPRAWGALYDPQTGAFSEIEIDGTR